MGQFFCELCKQEFNDDQYDIHIKSHLPTGPVAVEKLPSGDSDFIPEVEFDESGKKKPTPYKQKPYQPGDYEG